MRNQPGMAKRGIAMSGQSAQAHAVRIAEQAAEAWYQAQGSGGYETAVGVIAALALTARDDPAGPDPATTIVASSDQEIAGALAEIWSLFWIARPELARLAGPLANWVHDDEPDAGKVHAIADTARAAARHGLLDLAGTRSLRDTDVIGIMYQQMRSRAGAAPGWARGEFSTPPGVCQAMAAVTLGGPGSLKPGMAIAAGPAGTGEMLRAAAGHIRGQGMDPAEFWWIVHGTSPAAVAVTAVNCHLWGLGLRVVIGVADPVAEPGWTQRAWAEQQAAIAHRDDVLRTRAMPAAAGQRQVAFKPDPAVQLAFPDKVRPDAPGNSAGSPAHPAGPETSPPRTSRPRSQPPPRQARGRRG